jgi:hypothetical protein
MKPIGRSIELDNGVTDSWCAFAPLRVCPGGRHALHRESPGSVAADIEAPVAALREPA